MLGTICACIFREFANFFIDFAQIFKNLPDFQGFCLDFRLIKTFADVLAPPPTPLVQSIDLPMDFTA